MTEATALCSLCEKLKVANASAVRETRDTAQFAEKS